MGLFRFVLGFALAGLASAQAADIAAIGPTATAASILAARPATHEAAFEFVYRVEGGAHPGTMTVDLAADFIAVRQDNQTSIYDYALRRIVVVDSAAHGFSSGSLYALTDFRAAETYNRRYQHMLLVQAKAGDAAKMLEPFWVQSEIHLMDPQDGVPQIDRRDDGGTIRFSYDGKEVASYTPSPTAFTPAQSALLLKFFALSPGLHPLIARQIVDGGRLPARLTVVPTPGLKRPDAVWTLQSAATVEAVYPLSPSDRAEPLAADLRTPPLDSVLPLMLDAVARRAPGRRSAADYRADIEKALAEGRPFQAAVTAFEFLEQYDQPALACGGVSGCHEFKQIVAAAAAADPRMAVLAKALGADPEQIDAAVAALRAMKRDDLTNGYVIDNFLANDLVVSSHADDAPALFARAIQGNPYMGGYYKDLGDYYRTSFAPDQAWLCYDLGRALPGGPDAPVIAGMNAYESGLAARYPEFF